jgi:hypothetical protein
MHYLGTLFERLGGVQRGVESIVAPTKREVVRHPSEVALIGDEDDNASAELTDIGAVKDAGARFGGDYAAAEVQDRFAAGVLVIPAEADPAEHEPTPECGAECERLNIAGSIHRSQP